MNSFEFNKIFAAVLCAMIVAMLGGFVGGEIMHPHELHEDAVPIDGGSITAGGASKPKGPDPILALIATADIAKGEKLSKACAACHSFDQGGADKVGPNLHGVVGKAKGSKAGFAYSASLTDHGGSWTYEELNKFLWKPKSLISGTKMNYAGIKKPEDRAAMIAWLRQQGSTGVGLPSDADIAAEKAELAPEPEVSEVAGEAEGESANESETATEATAPAAH